MRVSCKENNGIPVGMDAVSPFGHGDCTRRNVYVVNILGPGPLKGGARFGVKNKTLLVLCDDGTRKMATLIAV